MAEAMRRVYGSYTIYDAMVKKASLVNYVPQKLMDIKLNPWAVGHTMPHIPKKSFHEIYRQAMKELDEEKKKKG